MFEKLRRWLNGVFICRKCKREFHVIWMGYGEAICSDCYNGEISFIFYDNSFWLNRILSRLSTTRTPQPNTIIHDPIGMDQIDSIPEVEVVKG